MPPGAAHPDCREFVVVVEDLLERRRAELVAGPDTVPAWRRDHWGPRTWSRSEFEDMVYASYKPMRQGRVTRPPRREKVMEIADYLDCTLDERNRLLLAARATPVSPYLTGAALDVALQVAVDIADRLPVPTVIINRDGRIHHLNAHTFALNGASPDLLAAVPHEAFNILHLLFDPRLPLHQRLIQNRDSWTRMVRQTILGFKQANLLCHFEPWYQALVGQFMTLPEFETHWHAVQIDAAASAAVDPVVLEVAIPECQCTVLLRPLLVSVGYFQFDFPQIVALTPADAASGAALRALGIPGF